MAVAASPGQHAERPRSAVFKHHGEEWILAGILLVGALLRFTTLGVQSFWFDEATTWQIVSHGLGHVFSQVPRTESTPPLYYVLLWLWSRVFGLSEAGLRSFSALWGTVTIAVVWAIGRRLASPRTGLIAALLAATNPLLLWYSQEARSYSLLLAMSALSLLALVCALGSPSRRRVLAWGVSCALALAAHYYAAVVIVPEALWLALVLRRRGLLTGERLALGLVPIVVVAGAQLPLMIRQNNGRASYIANSGSLPYRVVQLFKQDLIGEGQPAKGLLTAICAVAVVLGLALLLTRSPREERSAAVVPLLVGLGGILLAVVIANIGTDYFNTRNLLPTWPALLIVVAAGLGARGPGGLGALGTAMIVAVGLFCILNVDFNPFYQRQNWRGAAHVLGPSTQPRAIVSDIHSEVPLEPYLGGLGAFPATGTRVAEVDLVWLQRKGPWGPIRPLTPAALPGFTAGPVTRSTSYAVVRYRAARPTFEPYAALSRLYPNQSRALTLLQRP